MGSACCVATRDGTLPKRTERETLQRNVLNSPSWSFRWDNRRRVAGEVEYPSYQGSHGSNRSLSMEIKGTVSSERVTLSEGGSPHENLGTPISQKSPACEESRNNLKTPSPDQSMASIHSTEVKNIAESPKIVDSSAPNLSFSLPSAFSTPTVDHLASDIYPILPNSTPPRRAPWSPGHLLWRQVSDSRILGLKLPTTNSIYEGTPSFALSNCSNNSTTGSQGGSSDGWSMRTFSELVASQRERWSFDSDHLGSVRGKISESSSRFSSSSLADLHTCGACSKLLTERSLWSNELSVVAVMDCRHVYHADCLDPLTADADRFDPPCPICMVGEKQVLKMSKKALRAEADLKAKYHKISEHCIDNSYLDGRFDWFDRRKNSEQKGKTPKMGPSSSSKTSFAKPFLRRHLSLGSKWSRSLSENDSARKKGFWARYLKD